MPKDILDKVPEIPGIFRHNPSPPTMGICHGSCAPSKIRDAIST